MRCARHPAVTNFTTGQPRPAGAVESGARSSWHVSVPVTMQRVDSRTDPLVRLEPGTSLAYVSFDEDCDEDHLVTTTVRRFLVLDGVHAGTLVETVTTLWESPEGPVLEGAFPRVGLEPGVPDVPAESRT
jgi:hypothetical protein